MLEVKRDDFDENLEDIMESITDILNKKGYETEADKEEKNEKKE